MANEEVIKKLLVEVGYKTDRASQSAAADAINGITSAVVKLGAVLAATFSVKNIIDFNKTLSQTAYAAEQIGTTVQSWANFSKALGTAGISAQEAHTTVERFSD